ncbi:MAG TPA: 16S rRNA (cytidine(1402)-2'-O)-methyltransferase, partial [Acidimicrobiia bacterium]|nr:16S rRNA (cytidine(1402)-2'-O)-methyltransferase [Acidimicrobiia bacterium]
LVATPIGNLGDLSARGADALRTASLICCEDTRRTGKLLSHLGIKGVRMAITNEHTETERIGEVLQVLDAGGTVAVVSDAGTPGISDPGERLVRAAIDAGHIVSAVPGPAAAVMGLVVSGLPGGRYVFEGFLPRRGAERAGRLAEVRDEGRTVVLYEAPHRLERTLLDLVAVAGADRRIVLARELTKIHEEVWRGTLGEAVERVRRVAPIGEYVVVLDGAPVPEAATDDEVTRALEVAIGAGASKKSAVASVAIALGVPKNRVYEAALRLS